MATILQVAGATLVSVAAFLVAPPAGLALAGIFCLAFGIAAERMKK